VIWSIGHLDQIYSGRVSGYKSTGNINLHKFFNKQDLPWVKLIWTKYYSNGRLPGHTMNGSFWWKSIMKLLNVFKGISQAEAGSGDTILFWKDLWNGNILQNKYPQLFSFCTNENATLSMIMSQHDFHECFQLPLSEQAFDQYCELELFLQALQPHEGGDQWKYIWGSNQYSSNKAYKHLIG
jgi:hypothetical protein